MTTDESLTEKLYYMRGYSKLKLKGRLGRAGRENNDNKKLLYKIYGSQTVRTQMAKR